ncbi:unnamed protein product, partial [marine sediment metagenome]
MFPRIPAPPTGTHPPAKIGAKLRGLGRSDHPTQQAAARFRGGLATGWLAGNPGGAVVLENPVYYLTPYGIVLLQDHGKTQKPTLKLKS